MKKHVFLITIIGLILLVLPLIANAEIIDKAYTYNNIYWQLDDEGVLTITGTGLWCPGNNYNDNEKIKANRELIKKIIISDGITSIGQAGFYYFENLTSITIPDSVTNIGDNAFYCCRSLSSITIPDSVTSIGKNAFYVCSSLSSITIPDGITQIDSYTFSGCRSLSSITMPNSVTSIGERAFNGCSSLSNITIPNSVTSINDFAFYGCSSLSSITIPNSVVRIGQYAFYGCSSLLSVSIPDSVTAIRGYTFSGCSNLSNISIPDSITSIQRNAFYECSSLSSITIPDGITQIDNCTFWGCSSLSSITIPNSVTSISNDAFRNVNYNDLSIYGTFGSYSHKFAINNNISFIGSWNNSGKPEKGFVEHDEALFYFDDDGRLHEGWLELDDKKYYCDFIATYKTEYVNITLSAIVRNFGVLLNEDGSADYYFFDKSDGHMLTGLIEYQDFLFYFDDDGTIHSGWLRLDGNVYYCDPAITIGFLGEIYQNVPAIRNTGLTTITENGSSNTYYFDEDGKMLSGILQIENDYYSFAQNGIMECSCLRERNNKKYYFGENGKAIVGWKEISDSNYYFSPEALVDGKYYLEKNGVWNYYYFDNTGKLLYQNDTSPELLQQEQDILAEASQLLNDVSQMTEDNSFFLQYGYYPLHFDIINHFSSAEYGDTVVVGYTIKGGNVPIVCSGYWDKNTEGEWIPFEQFTINSSKGIVCMTNKIGTIRFRISIIDSDSNNSQKSSSPIRVTINPNNYNCLQLPKNITTISSEAFASTSCEVVIIPDGCTSIEEKAFMNCKKLIYISIPVTVTSIANNAFEGCDNVTIFREGN